MNRRSAMNGLIPLGPRHPVLRRVAARLAFLPVAVFVLMTIAFFIVNLVPSDPAKVVLGALSTPTQIRQFNLAEGLDGNTWTRYVRYVDQAFHGTLGHSYYDGSSVLEGIWGHVASTLELVVLAFILAWLLGTTLGVLSAYFRGSWIDTFVRGLVSVIQSIPDFVIGLLGASLLAYSFKLLPAPLGQLPVTVTPPAPITGAALVDAVLRGDGSVAWSAAQQAILPVLALGIFNSVVFARTVRTTMAEALDSPYVQFARSRGLRESAVIRLALRSCLVPTITYAGVVVASLLSGTAVVETAFSWQGLGQWAVTGILRSDLPEAEGFVLVSGVFVVLVYLVSDLLTLAVDPRLRLGQGRALRMGGAMVEPLALAGDGMVELASVLSGAEAQDDLVVQRSSTLARVGSSPGSVAVSQLSSRTVPSRTAMGEPPSAEALTVLSGVSHGGPGHPDGPHRRASGSQLEDRPEPATLGELPDHQSPGLMRRLSSHGSLQVGIGLGTVGLLVLAAFFAPLPYNPTHPYPQYTLVHPGGQFWLGTDSNGYDVLSRVIAAARNDVPIGLAGALIGAVVGTPLGLMVSGTGRRSEVIMRFVDLVQSLPVVLVAVVLAATSQGGSGGVIAAIALVNAPLFIRIVRAGAMGVKGRRFVEAARAMGASPMRIATRHVLPNVVDLILAQLSISIGFAILAIAALSYLGAGLSLTTPTWGGMINQGAKVLGVGDWWTVVAPAGAIAITVFAFNLVADGLQRMFAVGGARPR
jgi:ABC-type dipeptide/oligopeptide/nickel transport system permease component